MVIIVRPIFMQAIVQRFFGLRARARARVDPFFLDDFFVSFANFLGDRRFLDLVGIMLL